MGSRRAAWLLSVLGASAAGAMAAEPNPVVTVRAVRPDRELESILGLFRGSKAGSPAAALAAWKRASREPNRLGKRDEAILAAFNPPMVRELGTLDRAEAAFWFEGEAGRIGWGISIPNDDGTFAALATSAALSGGQAEPPLEGRSVDRLDGPGSPLMARADGKVTLSHSPDGLRSTFRRAEAAGRPWPVAESGWQARFDPRGLEGSRSLGWARVAEGVRAMGGREILAVARLEGTSLTARFTGEFGAIPTGSPPLDPAWLDWIPVGRPMVAFGLAIDPGPRAWEAVFGLADRVERVDPDRKNMAPLRLRLGLAARTAGLGIEDDILPHLRGISGWLGADRDGPDSGLLAIHLDDEASARRIFGRTRPRPGDGPGKVLGLLGGRAIRLEVRESSLLIGYGEGSIEASDQARARPGRSAGRAILKDGGAPDAPLASRVVAAWPGRIPWLATRGTPLSDALLGSPPVLWAGHREGDRLVDRIAWDGLDATVRRFLDLIPLDPPPGR